MIGMEHGAGSTPVPLTPFDLFTLRAALAQAGDTTSERAPLTMALLERGLSEAGLLWSRPADRAIVTFWDDTPIGPLAVSADGPGSDAAGALHSPHPILWGCSRDTLVCRADQELVSLVGASRRSIRVAVDDWNATEAWPAGAMTFHEQLRATIRVPVYSGTTILELAMLCAQMSRAVGTFFSVVGAASVAGTE